MTAAAQALAAQATTGAEATGQAATSPETPANLPEWANGVAPEVGAWLLNKKFADPQAALTSSYHLERMLGQDKIPLPKDASDKAGWDAVWAKLGRPEKPEAYFEGAADVWPEGFTPDPKLLEGFQKIAHEIGLNTTRARALAKWQIEAASAQGADPAATEAAFEAQSTAEYEALRREQGPKFDALVADFQRAGRFVDATTDEIALIERAIGTKRTIEIMAKLGGAFGKEMPFVDGKTPGGIPTPEQARARIADLKKDQAFVKRYTTGDAAALKEMTDLHAIAAQG